MILTYINLHNGQTLTPTAPYHVTPKAQARDQDVVDPIIFGCHCSTLHDTIGKVR